MENQGRRSKALAIAQTALLSLLGAAGAADLTDRQPLALFALWCACAAADGGLCVGQRKSV